MEVFFFLSSRYPSFFEYVVNEVKSTANTHVGKTQGERKNRLTYIRGSTKSMPQMSAYFTLY